MTWQLQEAKNRLSEVVREAQISGPQVITVRGKAAAVLLSAEEYRELSHPDKGSLLAFFQNSPWDDIELEVERVRDVVREIEL